jgi:hypothetical protein
MRSARRAKLRAPDYATRQRPCHISRAIYYFLLSPTFLEQSQPMLSLGAVPRHSENGRIFMRERERERERGGGIAEDQATPRDERRGAIRESKLSGYRQNRWARLHASRVMVYAPLPAAYMFMIQRMQTCGREGARNLCVTRASARDARKRDRDC